jgi:large subunit ribosomal protein L21
MMFAILETGSKQYKVSEGDVLEVELLDKNKISAKNTINFDSVLLIKDSKLHIGQPFVKGAEVNAKVLEEFKAPKIIVFKKKPKKQYKRTRGHRQKLHRIQIEKIGIKSAPKKTTKPKPKKAETKKEKE